MRFRWKDKVWDVSLAGNRLTIAPEGGEARTVDVDLDGDMVRTPEGRFRYAAVRDRGGVWVTACGRTVYLELARGVAADPESENEVRSPMTGKVVSLHVKAGDEVKKGQVLLVITAMKMEFRVESPRDGSIESVDCAEGTVVDLGQPLVRLKEA